MFKKLGGAQKVRHNTGVMFCSHCGKPAVLSEETKELAEQMRGFELGSHGRQGAIGILKIECPHCFEKYSIHISELTVIQLIDIGKWPLRGLADKYKQEYLEKFPGLATKK